MTPHRKNCLGLASSNQILNSLRQTLDSRARLAGHLQPAGTQVNITATQIANRVIEKFDKEPELKARIAQALLEVDSDQCST